MPQYQIRYSNSYGYWFSKPYATYAEALKDCMKEQQYQESHRYSRNTIRCTVVAYSQYNKDNRRES